MIKSEADVRAGIVRKQQEPARETASSNPSLADLLVPDLDQQLEAIDVQAALTIEAPEDRERVATAEAIERTLAQLRATYPKLTEADLALVRRELEGGSK